MYSDSQYWQYYHYPVGSAFSSSGSETDFHHNNQLNITDDNNYLDVSVSLSIVDSSEGGLALPMLGVSSEHGPSALSLGSDHTTHL